MHRNNKNSVRGFETSREEWPGNAMFVHIFFHPNVKGTVTAQCLDRHTKKGALSNSGLQSDKDVKTRCISFYCGGQSSSTIMVEALLQPVSDLLPE